MAFSKLAAPGTHYGPCTEPCNHRNCELTRSLAETVCSLCGKPIGYATPYGRGLPSQSEFVHARCILKEVK